MEVVQVVDRPTYLRSYSIADRLLFIECFDLRLGQLVERLFARWQLAPVFSPHPTAHIHVTVTCDDSLPEIPDGLTYFEIADGGQCFTDGVDLFLVLRNCLLQLQHGTPFNVRLFFKEFPELGDPILIRATSFAVCAALRRFGLFELHAAGVVHPENEKGFLIVGPSGSGKSTLALQLAMDGWPYLSDDEVLLSLINRNVEALGFRSLFAVNADTVSAIGLELSSETSKTCFEPSAVVLSSRRPQAMPRLLLFTQVSGEPKTRFKKLTQSEAMGRLIRACPWASYDTSIAGANLEVLSRLARQASAFDLHAGRDLLVPGCASELLSSISV